MNRRALPAPADPLSGYRDAIKVLGTLLPSGDPWRHYTGQGSADALLHEMFGAMVHLVISGVLLTYNVDLRAIEDPEWEALSEEEKFLVNVLKRWHAFVVTPAPNKIELESLYAAILNSDTETDLEKALKRMEEAELDLSDAHHAAILSHVETFQARLDKLVTRWRETMPKDGTNSAKRR